jgi:Hsp70 protein
MELELPVIIALAVLVVAVAYALGKYWQQREGVLPPPALSGTAKKTGGITAPPVSDREVRAVVSWLLSQAFEQTGVRVADDRLAYQRILEAAQKAVVELKSHDSFDVSLPYLTADANGPKHLEARLTREMIEELVK